MQSRNHKRVGDVFSFVFTPKCLPPTYNLNLKSSCPHTHLQRESYFSLWRHIFMFCCNSCNLSIPSQEKTSTHNKAVTAKTPGTTQRESSSCLHYLLILYILKNSVSFPCHPAVHQNLNRDNSPTARSNRG